MFNFIVKSLFGRHKPKSNFNRNPNPNPNPNFNPDPIPTPNLLGFMDYGKKKMNGGHDHRYNKGNDRTPAQILGDKKRRKDQD